MEPEQLALLEATLPGIREEHDQLIILHDQWRDYNDGKKLSEMEKVLSSINDIETEVNNITRLIDNGHRSYENI